MIILLDAGHGIETAGKRSPDETILEYKYCREIRDLIKNELVNLGF
jgi:N-acetylmuramoyl-L-alanine amidase